MGRILIYIGMICLGVVAFQFAEEQGEIKRQAEIEKRALLLEYKKCYDWQDIETILFGDIQE